MNLPGRLCSTTLGDLLGQLHRGRVNGILELVEASGAASGRAHRVFFDAGLVDQVETSLPAPRLGELLSRDGVLTREALGRLARRLTAEPKKRSGEILVEEQLASGEAVLSGLRRQLRLRLEALFRLPEALVRFHVRPPRGGKGARPLEPSEFLHDRPRARQRGQQGVASRISSAEREALNTLGLRPGADLAEVKRAFRRLAAEAHPDRHPDADAEKRALMLRHFAQLSAAYHTLTR
ncbi:MAG TPA: J domain-containing protein [Polyangiaceae bacterium]|nr:J domain-containing protein [Polyangiaceae bacterium]